MMSVEKRIERLEFAAAKVKKTPSRRQWLAMIVMMDLTIGGLRPNEPTDSIASRYMAQIAKSGLEPAPEDQELIVAIRAWYQRGVANAGWRQDTA